MKRAVVKIGHRLFAFRSVKEGAKVVELLRGAVQVDYEFSGGRREYFADPEARPDEIQLELVDQAAFRTVGRVPKARRLGYQEPITPT